MPETLLATSDLVKRFGGLTATDHLSLEVARGELHALIGPNGAGKTTLIGQLTGELKPDSGQIRFDGADITGLATHQRAALGLGRSFQITSVFLDFSALDNVAFSVQIQEGHSFRMWRDTRTDERLRKPARELLRRVGLDQRADILAANLSHGERRQLEIAMALAGNPKLLLLDEPMAGAGLEESRKLIELLQALKGSVTVLLVEHDMEAVFALADRITVLVYGRVLATGTPAEIRANAQVREAYLGKAEEAA
jgi:branched-chain amino acid transport system ATP-binding protein